ncbi:major capsid family protein, partial [Acinetobacter baumannii]
VAMGRPIRARTRDSGTMHTFDARTIDSTGAFLLGELERLDQTLHEPLANITWGRDIDLRSDVSIADEVSSFTNSTFAAAGGPSPTGKSWIGKNTDAIAGIALDIGKTAQPLSLWGMEIGYTIPELESARAVGRPVDDQKFKGMNLKYQMDIDEQVYIGDDTLGVEGLLNSSKVGATNVNKNWKLATPQEILDDVNLVLNNAWVASGFAVCPDKLLLPPVQFSLLTSRIVSEAGNISILEFLKLN